MIGVQVQPVPRDALEEFGLKERKGALVAAVTRQRAGGQGRRGARRRDPRDQRQARSPSRDDLVQTVMALKPGTTVPMKVLRDKQREDAERHHRRAQSRPEARPASRRGRADRRHDGRLRHDARRPHRRARPPAGRAGGHQRRLIMDVDPSGTAARAGLREGDVILQVNRRKVESAADASRSCRRCGRAARRCCSSGAGTRRSS